MAKCFLICAGDLLNTGIDPKEGDLIIACDAGVLYADALGLEPDVVIGDFDSLDPEDLKRVRLRYDNEMDLETALREAAGLKASKGQDTPEISRGNADPESEPEGEGQAHDGPEKSGAERLLIHLPVRKDDTDTVAALRYGLARGYKEFHMYAATGGMLDHTMANIQCLLFLKNKGAKGYIWDEDGLITVIKNEAVSFKKELEGRVSVFALEGEARGVSIEGLSYEARGITLKENFPLAVSNAFDGRESTISVEDGTLLIIMYLDREE